jgi:hypothetical protein
MRDAMIICDVMRKDPKKFLTKLSEMMRKSTKWSCFRFVKRQKTEDANRRTLVPSLGMKKN